MDALRLVVRGRVQGVGFRWFVRETARGLGLSGWVRNHADGSVEVTAAGPPDAMARLEAAVRAGPPGAHVTDVESRPAGAASELPNPFTVYR